MREKILSHSETVATIAHNLQDIGGKALILSGADLLLINQFPKLLELGDGVLGSGAIIGGIIGYVSFMAGGKIAELEQHSAWKQARKNFPAYQSDTLITSGTSHKSRFPGLLNKTS